MEPLDAFAANVRRLRHERGLTQERLAELADLHLTDIARIETRRRDPGVKIVAKIAHTGSVCQPASCCRASNTALSAKGPSFFPSISA
jgi:DNA-binding XRE family transcriptional regulator